MVEPADQGEMQTAVPQRRLLAILAADVVGYSRLIGVDEDRTLARVQAMLREVAEPAVACNQGRIFKLIGDAFLAEFPSALGAVQCAAAVQQAMLEREQAETEDRRLQLRIGVHLGDVVSHGTDLLGDGVNIAARLEGVAAPNGVALSANVADSVRGRVPFVLEDLGEQALKNIERPIRVFRITLPGAEAPSAVAPATATEPAALALPEKPSLVVLPFQNMSGDPEQEFFANGLVEDITTVLSGNRSLFVIARNSAFTYKGRTVEVRQIGRELGVRYLLEGSVRKAGQRIRITGQLIDATNGTHLWADRFDGMLDDVFDLQDRVTEAVAMAIGPAVSAAEMLRAVRDPPNSLGVWELYHQGLWHLAKVDAAANTMARSLLEKAIAQDAMFTPAHIALSRAYRVAGVQYTLVPMDEAMARAMSHARTAVQLDPLDAEAHALLAWALVMQGDMDDAREVAHKAQELNSGCAEALRVMGQVLVFTGQHAAGRDFLARFIRLSPRDANIPATQGQMAMSYYFEHDYEHCIDTARRLLNASPEYTLIYRYLAAALAQLGRVDEARSALDKAIGGSPGTFDVFVRRRVPWTRPVDYEHTLDGLRKAGWAE